MITPFWIFCPLLGPLFSLFFLFFAPPPPLSFHVHRGPQCFRVPNEAPPPRNLHPKIILFPTALPPMHDCRAHSPTAFAIRSKRLDEKPPSQVPGLSETPRFSPRKSLLYEDPLLSVQFLSPLPYCSFCPQLLKSFRGHGRSSLFCFFDFYLPVFAVDPCCASPLPRPFPLWSRRARP